MEKISVIIPVYNGERYLNECIDSIVNQTYSNLEIIIVNDGSQDKTDEICLEYAKADDRICYIKKSNAGVSSARNFGIENATGEYIAFIDADDYIASNYFEKLYDALKNTQSEIAFSKYFWDKQTKIIPQKEKFLISCEVNTNDRKFNKLLKHFFINKNNIHGSCCRCLFESKIIKTLKFSEELKYSEDLLFLIKCFQTSRKIAVVDEYLYFYRIHKGSATNNFIEGLLENYLHLIRDLEKPLAFFWREKDKNIILSLFQARLCERLFRNALRVKLDTEKKQEIDAIKKSEIYRFFSIKNGIKQAKFRAKIGFIKTWLAIKNIKVSEIV